MKGFPKKIYAYREFGHEGIPCRDYKYEGDIEYIRSDLASTQIHWIYDKPCPKDGSEYLRWCYKNRTPILCRWSTAGGVRHELARRGTFWFGSDYVSKHLSKAFAYPIEGPKE